MNCFCSNPYPAALDEKGSGIHVYDDTGKPYIEGMSGLWCAGLGFGNEELVEAATKQMRDLPYYHVFSGKSHEPAVELAEKIKEITPGQMARVIYQSSGSEANDTQVKLAWYYNNAMGRPEKKKIISRKKGYHGVTIVAASMTAQDLTDLIEAEGPDTIAAFIAEPVMGAGGVITPPKGYFEAIMPILQAHDILCISDEVICGFGRTGNWFGADTFKMQPTSISMAKQLTGGFIPLSAVAINRDMAEVIEGNSGKIGTFGHGFTYGGHPVGCAVGIKTLEIYKRDNIIGKTARQAPLFKAHLDRLSEHPLVGEARASGLMGALELSPNKTPKTFDKPGKVGLKAASEMLSRGVILRAIGDSLAFCPPMIISDDELDQLFAPVEDALDATLAWAKAEGHLDMSN